jgi:hypothetical protein
LPPPAKLTKPRLKRFGSFGSHWARRKTQGGGAQTEQSEGRRNT